LIGEGVVVCIEIRSRLGRENIIPKPEHGHPIPGYRHSADIRRRACRWSDRQGGAVWAKSPVTATAATAKHAKNLECMKPP
jgi:hypothetical protein